MRVGTCCRGDGRGIANRQCIFMATRICRGSRTQPDALAVRHEPCGGPLTADRISMRQTDSVVQSLLALMRCFIVYTLENGSQP